MTGAVASVICSWIQMLLNNIRYNKRKVSIVTVGDKYNEAICSFSDEQIKYEDVIKEDVPHTYIEALEEKIEKNLTYIFERNKSNYTCDPSRFFQHIGFEFFCKMQMKVCNLMIYEVYNCVKNLALDQKVVFYKYKHKSVDYVGICPYADKGYLKDKVGVNETGFITLDLESEVRDLYSKYKKDKD